MTKLDCEPVDWDELKTSLRREISVFAGPDLSPGIPGMADEIPGWREWNWYRSRAGAGRNRPRLTAADFALAYRNDPSFSRRANP